MGVALRYLAVSALLCMLPINNNPITMYSIVSLAMLGGLIQLNFGPSGEIMFKSSATGQVAFLSFIIHFPFHILNHLLIFLTKTSLYRARTAGSQVAPNIWLAGKNSLQVEQMAKFTQDDMWDCVVDLTCEFSETAQVLPHNYLNVPTWDGCPPTVEQIERCALFVKEHYKSSKSRVLVHCAHGVGRSTLVMCAVLVKLGLASNAAEALLRIKSARPVARLNAKMLHSIREWENRFAT